MSLSRQRRQHGMHRLQQSKRSRLSSQHHKERSRFLLSDQRRSAQRNRRSQRSLPKRSRRSQIIEQLVENVADGQSTSGSRQLDRLRATPWHDLGDWAEGGGLIAINTIDQYLNQNDELTGGTQDQNTFPASGNSIRPTSAAAMCCYVTRRSIFLADTTNVTILEGLASQNGGEPLPANVLRNAVLTLC